MQKSVPRTENFKPLMVVFCVKQMLAKDSASWKPSLTSHIKDYRYFGLVLSRFMSYRTLIEKVKYGCLDGWMVFHLLLSIDLLDKIMKSLCWNMQGQEIHKYVYIYKMIRTGIPK